MTSGRRPKLPAAQPEPAPEALPLPESEQAKKKVQPRKGRFSTILAGQLNNKPNTGLLQSVGGFKGLFRK